MAAYTFPARVLELSPVLYLRYAESGSSATDSSGNGNTGTHQASPTYATTGSMFDNDDGARTYAAASSQWTSVTDHATLDLGNGPLTYMAAIKRSSASDNGNRTIFTKGDQTPVLRLLDGGSSNHKIEWADLNWSNVCESTARLADTNWHLIFGTKTAGDVWALYLDGLDVTLTTVTGQTTVSTAVDLNIGRRSSSSDNFFDGSLDEIAIFNTALSAGNISELTSLWRSTRSTNLLAYGVSQDRERI